MHVFAINFGCQGKHCGTLSALIRRIGSRCNRKRIRSRVGRVHHPKCAIPEMGLAI